MQKTYRLTNYGLATLALAAVLIGAGCGGGGGSNNSNAFNSPYAGTYMGSGDTSTGNVSTIALTVNQSGQISGTATGTSTTSPTTDNLSGTVSSTGQVALTVTESGGTTFTDAGNFSFNSMGQLVGPIQKTGVSGFTYLTLVKSGQPMQFSGTYAGLVDVSTSNVGHMDLTIDSSGNMSGSANISGVTEAAAGTVNSSGMVAMTLTPSSGPAVNYNGGAAFAMNGNIIINVIPNSGTATVTTFNLSPSTATGRKGG